LRADALGRRNTWCRVAARDDRHIKIEASYSQNPRVLTVQKIAIVLEVTIDDLMKE
jgi:hypothetical protein